MLFGMGLTYYFIGERVVANADISADTTTPAAEDLSGQQIVVDISGAVIKPGIYKLDSDLRVGDLIALAGGMSADASIQYVARKLNLAQKIEDSQKIYIPFEWDTYVDEEFSLVPITVATPAISSGSQNASSISSGPPVNSGSQTSGGSTASQKTNVNSASVESLDGLPGIGPAYAQRIIDNRQYKNYEELVSKSKVPKTTLEGIKDLITY
jgi:competence protein ComEA